MLLEKKVVQRLIDTKKTLVVAESCTGGLLSSRLTDIPGSSACLKFSIVTYNNESKIRFTGVPPSLIRRFGAVSEQTALAMAMGVRKALQSDFSLSITGIAGPGGGSKRKPVGLTFIAVNTANESLCLKCQFKGTRKAIKRQASTQALKLLHEFIV